MAQGTIDLSSLPDEKASTGSSTQSIDLSGLPDDKSSTSTKKPAAPQKPQSLFSLDAAKSIGVGLKEQAKEGFNRVVQGGRNLITGSGEGGRTRAARDIVEGGFEAAEVPLMGLGAAAAVVNPLETAAGLGLGLVAQRGVQAISSRLGATDDQAALAGDVAGIVAPGRAKIGELSEGGFARSTESLERLKLSDARGLKMSAGEIGSGTRAGEAAKRVQGAFASTVSGGSVQAAARAATDAVVKSDVNAALDKIHAPISASLTGNAVESGIGAGHAGLRNIGAKMGAVAKHEGPVDVTPVTNTARDILYTEIGNNLNDFPGLSKGARQYILKARGRGVTGGLVQPNGTSDILPEVLSAIKEHEGSPTMKVARMVLDAKADASFEGAANARRELQSYVRKGDPAHLTPDQGLADKLAGQLGDILFKKSPAYRQASETYRLATEKIHHEGVDKLFNLAKQYPEKVVNAVGLDDVTMAKKLRQGMLDVGRFNLQESARGKQGFDAFRTSWFRQQILGDSLENMPKNLEQAEKSGVLKELFNDPNGKLLVQTAKQVSDVLKTRPAQFNRSMYLTMALAQATNNPEAGIKRLGAAEATSGFMTWLMYRPSVARWFVEGSKNPAGRTGRALLQRVAQAYGSYTYGTGVAQKKSQSSADSVQP